MNGKKPLEKSWLACNRQPHFASGEIKSHENTVNLSQSLWKSWALMVWSIHLSFTGHIDSTSESVDIVLVLGMQVVESSAFDTGVRLSGC